MTGALGWCVWITGLPGSGKSVVSRALLDILNKNGFSVQLLSSDELRNFLTPKPTYSLEERDTIYATMAYMAKLLTQNGVNVLIDATGNLKRYRDAVRSQTFSFIEAYLECPLDVCIYRETERKETYNAPTQIYQKALQNRTLTTVPGVGQPYETPLNPEVTVKNFVLTPQEAAQQIYTAIENLKK
ncbi:MAG: adenylyl-sulfate kinase [Nitrososphaerota archaeon]|uniref:adenylyl-sulfate kinase n=1 Tax=Candidatus Bathycorpusculum sp. TaxID=2994959 RepID=UPI002836BEE3|nr:adenylyl-sulfate kinase [Candidatus Termiticorpusculum sp.]MCL2257878.1 adenylyl-sulfate kinase [Candidatus Termiticorpusculum sp.]MCL2292002.1 adenylyl-sulfate kinase [Candidatus Termiticorpusculum sp.]MDR0461569.1 adenylyl-sulfate kinase [Nitrososphaerota archaeon]